MTVNTKTATGRRELHFNSLDDLLADAEALANGKVHLIGNWSLAKIYGHLARTVTYSLDGYPFKAPWFMRAMVRLFMKKKLLTRPLPSGFQIPEKNRTDFIPDNDETEIGLTELRDAIARFKTDKTRVAHPFLGSLTEEEWERFHCRHAELHMSFALPVED